MTKRAKAKLIFGACDMLIFWWGIGFTWFGINGLKFLDNVAVRAVAENYGYSGDFATMLFYSLSMTAGIGAIIGSIISAFVFRFAMKVHNFDDEE